MFETILLEKCSSHPYDQSQASQWATSICLPCLWSHVWIIRHNNQSSLYWMHFLYHFISVTILRVAYRRTKNWHIVKQGSYNQMCAIFVRKTFQRARDSTNTWWRYMNRVKRARCNARNAANGWWICDALKLTWCCTVMLNFVVMNVTMWPKRRCYWIDTCWHNIPPIGLTCATCAVEISRWSEL